MNRTQSNTNIDDDEEISCKRCFNKVNKKSGALSGNYIVLYPKQAASKCYTKIVTEYTNKGKKLPKIIKIYLYEPTKNKIYGYGCEKIIFDNPINVNINRDTGEEKNIVYRSKLEIKKIDVPENIYELVMGGVNKKFKTTKSAKKNDWINNLVIDK